MTTPSDDTDFYTWTQQQAAALRAMNDTGLPLVTFPKACSWPVAQVLDENF